MVHCVHLLRDIWLSFGGFMHKNMSK